MIPVYADYLSMPLSLSLEEMSTLHKEITSELGDDDDALELYEELVTAATRYIYFRSNWHLWSKDEKADKDSNRTSCHNSIIIKLNQLARYLKMQGKSASWRDVLGNESENPYYRKRMGDFACYLALINSLLAR